MDKLNYKLQDLLDKQIGKSFVHNVVAAVQSYNRGLDFIGASGVSDPQTRSPMTPDTQYFIASVSKTYTAAIVMRLYEKKFLNLEVPITEYLSGSIIEGIHVYKGVDYSDQIKVKNLIDHSSGLPDHESEKPKDGKSLMDELKAGMDIEVDNQEAFRIARNLTPRFPPGTPGKAHYSNTNYRLLAEIIKSITGKGMAENYQEFICSPLGFQNTYLFDWTAPRPGPGPATIYLKEKPAHVPKYLSSNVSDGGLVSTAAECVTFLRAFFEGYLFDKSHLERMKTWNNIFFPMQYGYGLMYFRLPRYFWFTPLPEFIGHSGSTGSFAFTCPSRSLYLAGTLNQIASPQRPFFFMINLLRVLN